MLSALKTALLATTILASAIDPAGAEVRTYSIPGDVSWEEAQQTPWPTITSPKFFLNPIDFSRVSDGIAPIAPFRTVAVPEVPAGLAGIAALDSVLARPDSSASLRLADRLNWGAPDIALLRGYLQEVGRFSWNVSKNDVVAEGQVLVPRHGDLPGSPARVAALRAAGIEEIDVLINVAESFPKPTSADPPPEVLDNFFTGVNLTSVGIFEVALRVDSLEQALAEVFDGDPISGFDRQDRPGQDLKQKFVLYIDLVHYFPVALLRSFPRPDLALRLSSYVLRAGVPDTEREIPGLNYFTAGNVGFPKFTKIGGTFPTYVELESAPVNPRDTIRVPIDPPQFLRHFRLDVATDLDYHLAEFQVFSDGFLRTAAYVTKPLPLPPATIGRIFWDEEAIGDPSKSKVKVSFQSGATLEPEVLYRIDNFNQEVEWICSDLLYAQQCRFDGQSPLAVDRRPESPTYRDTVDLDDPTLRLDARQVYSALSPEERFALRIPRGSAADETGFVGGQLDEKEKSRAAPDLELWSGFQPATNGGILRAPGGREYIQIRIDFSSDDAASSRVIRNLRFEYDAPQAAGSVLAEIAPSIGAIAGMDTTFVLAMMPTLGTGSTGFNRIQVKTPARIRGVEAVTVDRGAGPVGLSRIPLSDTGRPLPGEGEFKEIALEDNYFVVGIPRLTLPEGESASSPTVTIKFRGRVLDFNTTFGTNVFLDTVAVRYRAEYTDNGLVVLDSTAAGLDTLALVLPQRAEGPKLGQSVIDLLEAEGLVDRNQLSVTADISGQGSDLVTNLALSSNPFSPNGDKVNDELVITYDVLRLTSPSPVQVSLYDLSGRRVRTLVERRQAAGGYTESWDGTDDHGELVPPGLYMMRVAADTDEKEAVALKLVGVAY